MKWTMTKGIVKCERCGFITCYGYLDQDKICYNCNRGYFRFYVNEVIPLNIETKEE